MAEVCINREEHTLEYQGTHSRETTYVCTKCNYVEIQFAECDGF